MIDTAAVRDHVDATVHTWLGLRHDEAAPTLPPELARRLLRVEEHEQPHRDQWGNWEFAFCEAYRAGKLWEPEIDRWLVEQRTARELEAPWPGGRAFAVCLTHDVDLFSPASTPRQALRSMRVSLAGGARSRRERAVRLMRPGVRAARSLANGVSLAPAADTLERCVEIEARHGVTASYFFTTYPGRDGHRYDCVYDFDDVCRFRGERVRVRDVVRTLQHEGFDVGLHGSYNSALVPGLLAGERRALEEAAGFPVSTTRQHFVHWDVRRTPRLQSEAGLSADSTLGFNRNLGFRTGTSLPHRLFDLDRGAPLDLVEVPLLVHDGALLRPDALELGRELGLATLTSFLDTVREVGGLATVIVHPNNLARDEYLALFEATIEYGLRHGAWFASVRDVDAWWREREARLAA
jgi:peptidoglycan/xylan/chitin deacetylase (PgdA/CDA1 family)